MSERSERIKPAKRENMLAAMGFNRHTRRTLAKVNKIKKIAGSNKPIQSEKKKNNKKAL